MKRFLSCIALFLLAISLAGCGQNYGTDYTVGISSQFSQAQQDSISEAVDVWRARVDPGQLHIDMVIMDRCDRTENHHRICIKPSSQAEIERLDENKVNDIIGLTLRLPFPDSSNIYLAVDMIGDKPGDMRQTSEHELGHALGLIHTEPGTVMCKDLGCAAKNVTCADVLQYDDLRGFPLDCH